MAYNKVVYNGGTLIDLTGDTVTESDVAKGKVFHLANGEIAMGTRELCPFPINSIYTSVDSTNPSEIWEDTVWESFGSGKMLVGVDSDDTDFNGAEKIGGSKGAWYHTHTQDSHTHTLNNNENVMHSATALSSLNRSLGSAGTSGGDYNYLRIVKSGADLSRNTISAQSKTATNKYSGSSDNQLDVDKANMPPYITVYMWKRIA